MPKRADILLVEQGLCSGRERAKALIMEGVVYFGEVKVLKPSDTFADGAALTVREDPIPFVSRGGLKLDKAVRKYAIDLNGAVCLDVGASTGGFTDCMLQNGARKVYSVDVGYGQLDWKLRNDPRVVCMERRNARNMEPAWFDETPAFASCDVSFISIKLILPKMYECLSDDGSAVVLVKPQFEAGRGKVGKNGVVRDAAVHKEVLISSAEFAVGCGFNVVELDYSPITGPKGNIEYLMYLTKREIAKNVDIIGAAENVVSLSHSELS
ncbi:MAG: TlyA family RNA methyltransferase [Clostridiales bacterium]|nr:TlyA family RNA methyltransferase [Clostridiales bacterium]